MKNMLKLIIVALVLLIVTNFSASAADHTIDEWSFGPTVVGKKITKKQLKGQVVLLVYWGVH